MSADDFDMGTDGEAQASPEALTRLRELIKETVDQQALVETLEEQLASAKRVLHVLKTVKLPDVMIEIQSPLFTHAGVTVELDDFVSGSLPKEEDRRKAAIAWLVDHEGGELIKTSVSVDFSRSQHNEALDLAAKLEKEGHPVVAESGVHPQTLMAWAKARIRDGEPLDADVLGLYTGKVVKFKKAKEKGSKAKKGSAKA